MQGKAAKEKIEAYRTEPFFRRSGEIGASPVHPWQIRRRFVGGGHRHLPVYETVAGRARDRISRELVALITSPRRRSLKKGKQM
jgi:hypothetical protein